ncbi:MAG: chromosome segregation protein SMC [Betaproteobacteria bacterium]|nr:chromosome segregation protein SMC [Betaproteobacteria bacterium]
MRLTEIKLAGFKSFVDPTHIPVPGHLVGIVGPNGCGKSNVIDAVRWVLGESSARHLRGETMQDVLFNGAGSRQAVNRASVELIFDNSLGKTGGQWANYAEISVKRVLEREAESAYYINNLHVRRRDIADIFLGTGLGARAYAIIEQGMISRVIEAKPEELRIFLEEAAGVSKYRERRRETELRLADTRENLLRVEDIRLELDKQLEHLRAQADVARQYHSLQEQLRTTQNLLWLQKKREAGAARERCVRDIEKLGVELEAETARLRETERKLEELRARHHAAGDALHTAQGSLYETNAEFSHLQQQIQHVRENRSRVDSRLAALRGQLEQGESQLQAQRTSRNEWQQQQQRAQQQADACQVAVAAEAAQLPVAEQTFRACREQRDALQQAVAENAQALQLEQTRREHALKILAQLAQREQRLREEQAALAPPDSRELERMRGELAALEARHSDQRNLLEAEETRIPQLEQALREQGVVVDAAAQQATALEARVAALKQVQERIARSENMQGWLVSHHLDSARRLWQDIEIEAGWEDALEAVLRERLSGIGLGSLEQAQPWLSDLPPGKMTVYTAAVSAANAPVAVGGLEPLAAYVRCKNAAAGGALHDWLHQVYVVKDRHEGLTRCRQLPAGALLVSGDGHVFTRHSVNFHAPDSELHGVLSRQREIEQLTTQLAREQAQLATLRSAIAAAEAESDQRKTALNELRASADELQRAHHEAQLAILKLSEQAQRVAQRGEQIAAELAEIDAQSGHERAEHDAAQASSTRLDKRRIELQAQLAAAAGNYSQAEAGLERQRQSQQQAERTAQEASFHLKTCTAKIAEVDNAIKLIVDNVNMVRTGIAQHEQELGGLDDAPLNVELGQVMALRSQKEQALAAARGVLEATETALRQTEQDRLTIEQNLNPIRERINEVKLKEQEARLTEEQFAQQLADASANEQELVAQLEKGKRSGALQADITRLNAEIGALGAVNLAALEELETAQQRKNYLDSQSLDLNQALATLEDAIRRIDRETRERLQHTFDEVNRHFGQLFPSLFGGGQARLLLTGEEILDSGVQVIAQPPGKKNSSIHLLSGGEKALTALSLLFALFQLNPAPFCLLDEVDAPLDDTNTERFCDLVRKMSVNSQFLFISHNKITMEIANQLIGITMQEAGVSRVVAVDIEEAMKLAEEAA